MLILASASSRRLDLLRQIGISPDVVIPADIDESPVEGEIPRQYAQRIAREKAVSIRNVVQNGKSHDASRADAFILAADTVVACGRRILPKAEEAAVARHCLMLLSGRSHRVYTAICIVAPDGQRCSRVVESRVSVKRLHTAEVTGYIESGEWRGKAGGYAIQGRFAAHIRQLTGSYSGIVGLPLFEVATLLRGIGYHWD